MQVRHSKVIDRDAELEDRILRAYALACTTHKPEHWQEFTRLVHLRSPQQVARMEKARGIE